MEYYIHENLNVATNNTAYKKARFDVERILDEVGFLPLEVKYLKANRYDFKERIKRHFDALRIWNNAASSLKRGDVLFIQYPEDYDFVFFDKFLNKLNRKGVNTIGLIHDIDIFRFGNRGYSKIGWKIKNRAEKNKICSFKQLIVLNDNMKEMLNQKFSIPFERLHSLYLWDYLSNEEFPSNRMKSNPIIIAGYFDKQRGLYLNNLPRGINFEIFGETFDIDLHENVTYRGVFDFDKLAKEISNGSFGLIWYGNSKETCDGLFGEYYKIINPHKASLYLSHGMPLIIWDQAGISRFVVDNKCGITVSSLDEIKDKIDSISNDDYISLMDNAKKIGCMMREGYFLKQALNEILFEIHAN